MLEHVLTFVVEIVGHALARSTPPARPAPRPDPLRIRATAAAYEEWMARRGLSRDDGIRGQRGELFGCDAVLWHGLDESAPGAVELELRIEHAHEAAIFRGPASSGGTPLEQALCARFDDPALARELRSIALTPSGVRLRLRPLTPPPVLELAASAVIEAVRQARSAGRDAPYR